MTVTDFSDKSVKESVPSFALETASELSKLRGHTPLPPELFATNAKETGAQSATKPRILFFKGDFVASALIEESLLRHLYEVISVSDEAALIEKLSSEPFDLVLMDHSMALNERIVAVGKVRARHLGLPILLVFPPLSEEEASNVKRGDFADVLVRDMDGAYLLRIPDRIGHLLEKRKTTRQVGSPVERKSTGEDEITEQVDLQEVANGLLDAISETQNTSLTVVAGPDVGKISPVGENTFFIGRDPSCQLRLKDESISRYHAKISRNESGRLLIEDLDSTNGTFIGGDRIKKQVLNEGDKILLGQDTLIKFQKQDSIEKNYYDELYYASTRDGLTGIYNRKFCLDKIGTDLSYARRHTLPVSLMIFDVDHFKKVNDTYGHPTGDAVLAAIAQVSSNLVRAEDILGRFGGEEFMVFAMDTDLLGAQILAERIRDNIQQQRIMALDGSRRLVSVTISVGIATTSAKTVYDYERLMATADDSLYRAKHKGRNCVIAVELFE